nr:hypothetical protein [Tanacetum cinerariifolium]
MVNMVPHEGFACSCAEGDVVLRQSYKSESCGKPYYACPKSKAFEAHSNMVQSMWLVNNENNQDAWQWPQHEMADSVSDKRLMNEEEAKPLQKRWNSSL